MQEKTETCGAAAACACGAAIRAGGDVFVVHRCSGKHFVGFTHLDDDSVLTVLKIDDRLYRVGLTRCSILVGHK